MTLLLSKGKKKTFFEWFELPKLENLHVTLRWNMFAMPPSPPVLLPTVTSSIWIVFKNHLKALFDAKCSGLNTLKSEWLDTYYICFAGPALASC